MTQGSELILVLMRADNHNVGADMEVIACAIFGFIGHPRAHVHVRDPDPFYVRISTGQAVFHPLHESGIEATRFIVWITGNSGKARPLAGSLSQNAILASRSGWPIPYRRVIGDETRPCPKRISDLLLIRGRMMVERVRLREGRSVRHQQNEAQCEKT